MNLHWPLFRKPEPVAVEPLRRNFRTGQIMPSERECKRRTNAVSVRLEFEMLKLHTPPEQFQAAIVAASFRTEKMTRQG